MDHVGSQRLFENIGTVVDGMTMLGKPITVTDKPDAKPLVVKHGGITFDDVSFHYGENKGVINHLNLNIKPGEKVGLVGRSGAGKSTLVNLLLRFHDVESGRILIDGQPISEVTQESLRSKIGMVTQDTSLLHRSIRDNILYGNPNATEEQLLKATAQAHAHEFILGLTDPHGNSGYDAQSVNVASNSLVDNVSGLRSLAYCSKMRHCWCWMKRLPRSILKWKRRFKRASMS